MTIPIFQVDAFTEKPFTGNPAAVCILPEPRDERWMQNVAMEMNLSETAFLVPEDDGFGLRWFTPAVEVDLCGHATLASAHILWQRGYLGPRKEARFHTKSGLLMANRQGDWIELNFPADPAEPVPSTDTLLAALAVEPTFVGRNHFDYLVEVDSEDVVRELRPDFKLLLSSTERGVMVTSKSNSTDFDFISRFFAPAAGIDEDPVTGSAHCCLGPYWAKRLGKDALVGYQASKRGGVVRVRIGEDRVYLKGQAITVLQGELLQLATVT